MKRRSFFASLAALIAAPKALEAAPDDTLVVKEYDGIEMYIGGNICEGNSPHGIVSNPGSRTTIVWRW